ncbi:putative late blight resistance protein homolog R1B-17 [Andrographis paniculata]|uniref:putative late blight resistance protein homolog R1B-17 n=1 Tax=Andrographis paniculata TaxID=175694 RepID=UPI0021E7E177|nr:putative late blight resistance protein homolog R1B-17 [Andrographis paniculata]
MAVAAYASLVSLSNILENLHNRAEAHLPSVDMEQIEMLEKNIHILVKFVELHAERNIEMLGGLWRQIAKAAFEAEATINFHVVNQLQLRSQEGTSDTGFSAFCEDMARLIRKFCSINEEMPIIEEEGEDPQAGKQPSTYVPTAGSITTSSITNVPIGIFEHVDKIWGDLVNSNSKRKILPIVGMGGIGKTTLARTLFDDSFIDDHFDIRIWLSISQVYSIDRILKVALQEEGGSQGTCESSNELEVRLYQRLFDRRYLIVLDDVWTREVWDDLQRCIPDNENGSCVLLTTRLSDIAMSLSSNDPYKMTFLDDDKSWALFCQYAFAQIGCPYENLKKFAKDVVKSCRGLPLEIVSVGGLLANSDMTPTYWENIVKKIYSLSDLGHEEHCLRILSLSYKSLPIHLKPCFLYMRAFPEDDQINVGSLIDFWIAEGFIKSMSPKTLEETGREFVKCLIDRNLIFMRNAETCGIHDLLRDLCVRESNDEQFIRSPRVQYVRSGFRVDTCCFLCSKEINDRERACLPSLVQNIPSSSKVSPSVCDDCKPMYSHVTRTCLLRTVDNVESLYEDGFCKEILQPTELRYASISLSYHGKFASPSVLHLLWNLQTLIIDGIHSPSFVLPRELWKMPQLRHIRSKCGATLPDPEEDFLVLNNLQTLSIILNFKWKKETIARIPNLKKLSIRGEMTHSKDSVCNLRELHELKNLESLSVAYCFEQISFPSSLKEVFLLQCKMEWKDVSAIGTLPCLETLTLFFGVEGSEWNPVEGEFSVLKQLFIGYMNLVQWNAESIHFPKLERLRLCDLDFLEEIPAVIGDISTLQTIQLSRCCDSVIESAKQLWEDQQEYGSDVRIEVTDKNGVSYRIGSSIARTSATACVCLAYLKRIGDRLQEISKHGECCLNTKQMKRVEEDTIFLRDFVKVHHLSKIGAMESLASKITQVDCEALIALHIWTHC